MTADTVTSEVVATQTVKLTRMQWLPFVAVIENHPAALNGGGLDC